MDGRKLDWVADWSCRVLNADSWLVGYRRTDYGHEIEYIVSDEEEDASVDWACRSNCVIA